MYAVRNKFFAGFALGVFTGTLFLPLVGTVAPNATDFCGMGCAGICCCLPGLNSTSDCAAATAPSLTLSWVNCASFKLSPVAVAGADLFLAPYCPVSAPAFCEVIFSPFYPATFTAIVLPPPEPPPWLC